MVTEAKKMNGDKNRQLADSNVAASQEKEETSGFFMRFLKWIAKGAIQSRMNTPICTT